MRGGEGRGEALGACRRHVPHVDRELVRVRQETATDRARDLVELFAIDEQERRKGRIIRIPCSEAIREVDPVRVVAVRVERQVDGADGERDGADRLVVVRRFDELEAAARGHAREPRGRLGDEDTAATAALHEPDVRPRAVPRHRHDVERDASFEGLATDLRRPGGRDDRAPGRREPQPELARRSTAGRVRARVAGRGLGLDRQPRAERAELGELRLQRLALDGGTEQRPAGRCHRDQGRRADDGREDRPVLQEDERRLPPERARHDETVTTATMLTRHGRLARVASPRQSRR